MLIDFENKAIRLVYRCVNYRKFWSIYVKEIKLVIAKRELKKAGFDSLMYTAHSLRHSAASNAIRLGVSLEEVCQMLRHKSIATTMIYNHANEELENTAESSIANALEGFNELQTHNL
ncbi:MAG: tyrosine-type recombinase/integrase [Selenomonadaceae bacterium]|nr:tyrosine-type recombinase/integrase [Selenomonadaceae bacterium]